MDETKRRKKAFLPARVACWLVYCTGGMNGNFVKLNFCYSFLHTPLALSAFYVCLSICPSSAVVVVVPNFCLYRQLGKFPQQAHGWSDYIGWFWVGNSNCKRVLIYWTRHDTYKLLFFAPSVSLLFFLRDFRLSIFAAPCCCSAWRRYPLIHACMLCLPFTPFFSCLGNMSRHGRTVEIRRIGIVVRIKRTKH